MPTSASQSLINKVLSAPNAAHLVEAMQKKLQEEREKRLEFYEWVTEDIKAEFINGQIIVHSPVMRKYWDAMDLLSSLMSIFVRKNKLGKVGTEKVMIALDRNDYEPDLVFFSQQQLESQTPNQVLFPAPTLAVEILSKGTASRDRGIKKEDYALSGIPEYWIIDPEKRKVEQYLLFEPESKYLPARIFMMGETIECKTIPGFSIPVDAIFEEEANLECLESLLKK